MSSRFLDGPRTQVSTSPILDISDAKLSRPSLRFGDALRIARRDHVIIMTAAADGSDGVLWTPGMARHVVQCQGRVSTSYRKFRLVLGGPWRWR